MHTPTPKASRPPTSATRVDQVDSASPKKAIQANFAFLATTRQEEVQPLDTKSSGRDTHKRKSTKPRRPGPKRLAQPVAGSSAAAKAQWQRRKEKDDAKLCRIETYVPKTTRDCAQLQAAARGLRVHEIYAEAIVEKIK